MKFYSIIHNVADPFFPTFTNPVNRLALGMSSIYYSAIKSSSRMVANTWNLSRPHSMSVVCISVLWCQIPDQWSCSPLLSSPKQGCRCPHLQCLATQTLFNFKMATVTESTVSFLPFLINYTNTLRKKLLTDANCQF